jgi:hypothetical protein
MWTKYHQNLIPPWRVMSVKPKFTRVCGARRSQDPPGPGMIPDFILFIYLI